ncbi:MAG: hypothetical protein EXS08_07990 [Planctomycetes bacterium]|nr:hypothetical protein [Planctomycetota bacterium]
MAKQREEPPWSELSSLEAALEKGLASGYALRGEERYFRERAITALRKQAEALGYELCAHEAQRETESSDFALARLIDDLSGGGLFAARRLVLVRNPGDFLKKVDGDDSALTRAALSFVKSGDAGTLVLSEPSLRADHGLVKAIVAAGGRAPAFRKLWDAPPPWKPDPLQAELVQWALRRAGELSLRLTGEQALYVCAATGNDLSALDDQLERLRASGGRDLKSIVSWTAAGSPWTVSDHLLDGDLPRALAGVEQLFLSGFQEKSGKRLLDPAALAVMLVGSLQRGARAALELSRPGADPARFPGSPSQREAALARSKRRPHADWHALLEDAAGLERALKSGAGADGSDFAALALRWSLAGAPRALSGARR